MDSILVELYVYDLSQGMARQLSAALLGTHIDAIYHTSIVMDGVEYVYDGGIQTVRPGETHLGRPMQIIPLGRTSLPMEIIIDYLDSMRTIYTAAAYDLWRHNCNNFSNDFATFLVGKGIPEKIANLPETVLNTPFGRMLQPRIDDMVKANKQKDRGILGLADGQAAKTMPESSHQSATAVKIPTTSGELEVMLEQAAKSCAIIFFTSKSCGPCKPLRPIFEELAAEAGKKAEFIIIDIGRLFDVARKYSITATPTFITFLAGQEENRWLGADTSTLRTNVTTLMQMAWPPHPHESLRLPMLQDAHGKPVIYSKVPPLDKLMTKIGEKAEDPAVQGIRKFIAAHADGAAEATLPDMDAFSWFLQDKLQSLPLEVTFAVIDLLRVAMADPRFSGYYAEEKDHKTIGLVFDHVNKQQNCPYSLRLVALQTGCNLFSSPLYIEHVLCCQKLTAPIIQLVTTSLLDDKHQNVRVAAASLIFNIASANCTLRTEECREGLPEGDQVELAASLLEAIGAEEDSSEALRGFLLAFGHLVYCSPKNGELVDLLRSMDAQSVILAKRKLFPNEASVTEIGDELLGKGI
ncbi:MAG: hypothetical protein M1818_003443 [Claussenomyces sp. TS43310]|nr:MAG: hypothetical protein M1818_003443 [Claussenomyces sp. TS43310]